jgi:hypothetical protein
MFVVSWYPCAEEIEQAIRALVAGQTHLDPEVLQRLVAAVVDDRAAPGRDSSADALPDEPHHGRTASTASIVTWSIGSTRDSRPRSTGSLLSCSLRRSIEVSPAASSSLLSDSMSYA